MPDYNTRLRTNAQILPPRRLRQDESSSQSSFHRPRKPSSLSPPPPPPTPPSSTSSPLPCQPHYPFLTVQLHPEDATNKTFLAIGRALFSVENRAVTIKDLSYLTMKHGLACQNASAASQAITTFIRNHLNRCRQDHSMPLLLSILLTGTDADDRLIPALHSRCGGNPASLKSTNTALTNFRRGTTVWYLSEAAGATCPFKRAGLSLDDIISPVPQNGTKRKREPQPPATQSRKCHVTSSSSSSPSPASVSSTSSPTRPEGRQLLPKIKLTLKLPSSSISNCYPLSPSDSEAELSSTASDTDGEDDGIADELDPDSPALSTASLSSEDDSDDGYDSSDAESSVRSVHDEFPLISPSNSELYPDHSPIPSSSSSSVPCNDPYSFYFTQNLCSTRLIKSTFTSFLSNPSRDSRAESISPSQSAASPPPDSEDEDDDYHNSMIGLRRDGVPIPQNHLEVDSEMPKFEPISPKFVPGSVHLTRKTPDLDIAFEPKQVSSSPFDSTSTPLETLPGFVLDAESTPSHVTIKEEEPTITLPLSTDLYLSSVESKVDSFQKNLSTNSGSIDDPIQVDSVYDVEILGPETVRSREWDMAWNEQAFDGSSPNYPLSIQENGEDQTDSSDTHEQLVLSPSPCLDKAILPSGAQVVTSTLSCSPPIMVVSVDDVWLYWTMLGPDAPLVRRTSDDMVDLTRLHRSLQTLFRPSSTDSPSSFDATRTNELLEGTWVTLDVARGIVAQLHDHIPADILNLFLSPELGRYFPNLRGFPVRDYPSNIITVDVPMDITEECGEQNELSEEDSPGSSSEEDVCIRVEDLFGFTDSTENTKAQEKEVKSKMGITRSDSARSNRPSSTCPDVIRTTGSLLGSWEQNVALLNEQEEELFHSIVDLENGATSRTQHLVEKHALSPLACSPTISCAKSNETAIANMINEKENLTSPIENKGRRNRLVPTHPVRRSTRVASKAIKSPLVTRSRRKTK